MKNSIFTRLLIVLLLVGSTAVAQRNNSSSGKRVPVKNVIFMIGDGMGLAQVTSAMFAQSSPLAIERAQAVGVQKTYSTSSEVTDSAASGTALATGTKTYNGAIGVDPDKKPLTSILKRAEAAGLATGVVATYSVTNATPAAFVANNESRSNEDAIATDYLKTDIDLFIGGGLKFFEKRQDGRNISEEMRKKGYQVVYSMDDVKKVEKGRIGALLADNAMPTIKNGRGNMLPEATAQALKILSNNSSKGLFIMVEGSQIDGGGHDNDAEKVILETLDFDAAVKIAFDFADNNPGTLVVVTADHETGGMTLPESKSKVTHKFATGGHTGCMVPIYAYGTGAEEFTGVMQNTDIPKKIAALLKLK